MLRLARNILQRPVNDFRAELHAHLQRLSLAFHSRRGVRDLLCRLTTDTCAIQTLAMNGLFSVLTSVALLGGMVVVLLQLDWQLIAATPPEARSPGPLGVSLRGRVSPGLCVWWRHTGGGAYYAGGCVWPSAGGFPHDCNIFRTIATDGAHHLRYLLSQLRVAGCPAGAR
jgi:hypothetical protein